MTARHFLDFRAGNPWTDAQLRTLSSARESAWADASHPSSEGRRSATWRDASRATVAELTGYPHVAFVPNRVAALDALTNTRLPRPRVAAATHQQWLLPRMDTVLSVDEHGVADFPSTGSVFLQHANAETGIRDHGAADVTVVDATSTLGRVSLPDGVDIVIADSRAWGSAVDITLLLSRRPLQVLESVSTLDIIVAVDQLSRVWPTLEARLADEHVAMHQFRATVEATIPDVAFHGASDAPHLCSFSVLHLDGETLMRALDREGFVVGSGSACVQDGTPSHVLAAMGAITHGNVRLALPVGLDLSALDEFALVLQRVVIALRREAGVDDL